MSSLLEMRGIKKSFNVPVLKSVDFSLNEGEVLGLIGENGAGKSTLIKILCGVYSMDEGEIWIDGKLVHISTPDVAQSLGISIIFQELSLFPSMTIAENIFIHREHCLTKQAGLVMPLDKKTMNEKSEAILREKLGVEIDVKKRIGEIPLAQRQIVEIARALSTNARIVIMDEPTTALETKEKMQLFEVISSLKAQGCAIIFISHHIDELFLICDRINVLRDGQKVLDKQITDVSTEQVVTTMIGKSLKEQYPKKEMEIGENYFIVQNLAYKKVFSEINFSIHRKEIVGIVGLEGCGKSQLIRALFGLFPHSTGSISLNGAELSVNKVSDAVKNRIAFLPPDRKVEGIFPQRSVKWNVTIAALQQLIKNTRINEKTEKEIVNAYVSDFKIKLDNFEQPISDLSGGNQQKVMLARWFLTNPEILLLEEPTRGIDVNAKTEVYNLITKYIETGKGVLIVSSDEAEVYGICDRIIIMHEGRITKTLYQKETSLEQIKLYSRSKGDIVE